MLSGFELYPRWVPLFCYRELSSETSTAFRTNKINRSNDIVLIQEHNQNAAGTYNQRIYYKGRIFKPKTQL